MARAAHDSTALPPASPCCPFNCSWLSPLAAGDCSRGVAICPEFMDTVLQQPLTAGQTSRARARSAQRTTDKPNRDIQRLIIEVCALIMRHECVCVLRITSNAWPLEVVYVRDTIVYKTARAMLSEVAVSASAAKPGTSVVCVREGNLHF